MSPAAIIERPAPSGPMAPIRRHAGAARRRLRMARVIANAMRSRQQPILAQIVPMRRCNLSCTYCNEYDKTSDAGADGRMLARIDKLAELGTWDRSPSAAASRCYIPTSTSSFPDPAARHIAALITNGYLLSGSHQAAEPAGPRSPADQHRQVLPDDVSKKSLKVLDKKLRVAGGARALST